MPHASIERGTPTVHAAAWDPASSGRVWTSKILTLDAHASRIAPSTQRRRDGSFMADRAEKLLSAYPHTTVKETKLAAHPNLLRDGSPRDVDRLPVWKWDHPTDYTTSQNMFYANPRVITGGQAAPRPYRHEGAMPRRVSPAIYATVFGRQPGEPAGSPRAMPPQSKVAYRGAAHVPTEGHWADPPLSLPVAPEDDEYRIQLMEAQLRSEQRIRMATLALAADKAAAMKRSANATSGALTARF